MLPWFINWAHFLHGLIVGKRRAEGGDRCQYASVWLATTSGFRCNLRAIEAWTRVLVRIQVHVIEIAVDLYLVEWCDFTQRNILSCYNDLLDFRGLITHK